MVSLWGRWWWNEQAQTRRRGLPAARGPGGRVRPELAALEDRSLPSFLAPFTYTTGPTPLSLAVGDFNRDGNQELAVGNVGNNVSVVVGDGKGGFATARNYRAGAAPISVAVGDFNGDFSPDLAVADNFDILGVSVLLGISG